MSEENGNYGSDCLPCFITGFITALLICLTIGILDYRGIINL